MQDSKGSSTPSKPSTQEQMFDQASRALFDAIKGNEQLVLNISGEDTEYLRFNKARVRQISFVQDAHLEINLIADGKQISSSMELTGSQEEPQLLKKHLEKMRTSLAALPKDPFIVEPLVGSSSREVFRGKLATATEFVDQVLKPFDYDLVGIHQSGTSFRGIANSKGLKHWFETDGFATDYSIFHSSGKAVKGTFAGNEWDREKVKAKLNLQSKVLERLNTEPRKLKPGAYRAYFEPDATADLIGMLSYYGVSMACLKQGESPLAALFEGKKKLSDQFNVTEDFSQGLVPRFNEFGELAPQSLPIFSEGHFKNSLISPRTAKEYGLASNGATSEEGLRSPAMAVGNLASQDALKQLGTGIYLSNLHYLNWSDVQGARVTGMTRYACMWVENGEFVAPIVDMRFDESLFDVFGPKLKACTSTSELIPNVGSYGGRNLGGVVVPGMLVDGFTFTL
jgi:predicted Zn-dependent protease